MGKINIMHPRMMYPKDESKSWISFHDNGGVTDDRVTFLPGIIIEASLSGSSHVDIIWGPVPDPLPVGDLTLELAFVVNSISGTIGWTTHWAPVTDNDGTNKALSSEAAATQGFTTYGTNDLIVATQELDATTETAGDYIFMVLDFSHGSWPSQNVLCMPSLHWTG